VDHQPQGRHKRFDEALLRSLDPLLQGSPADVLLEAAAAAGIAPIREVVARSRLDTSAAESALRTLVGTKTLLLLEDGDITAGSDALISTVAAWNATSAGILESVEAHHARYPLRRGIPREELKSRVKASPRAFNAVVKQMAAGGSITDTGGIVAKAGHEIKFDGQDQARVEALMRRFEDNPFSPPGIKECKAEVGEEAVNALIVLGELVAVSDEVIFRKSDYVLMRSQIQGAIEQRGKISLAEVRDMLGTTRKYVQALLEHLDSAGFTMRDGDYRILRR
jgi:selenocysteine-specific elongation factor